MKIRNQIKQDLNAYCSRWNRQEGVLKVPRQSTFGTPDAGQQIHNFPEIFLQISGQHRVSLIDEEICLYPGEALLIPAGTLHIDRTMEANERFQMLVLIITENRLLYLNAVYKDPASTFIESAINSHNRHSQALLNLVDAATGLLRDPNMQPSAYSTMAAVLHTMHEGLDWGAQEGWTNKSDFLSRVDAVVESNLDQVDCDVAKVAKMLGMSPNYLSSRFRKETGMRLGAFILEGRLNLAKRLLLNSKLPVADIAPRSGFRDSSYFIRCFRKKHGHTPLQFRHKSADS